MTWTFNMNIRGKMKIRIVIYFSHSLHRNARCPQHTISGINSCNPSAMLRNYKQQKNPILRTRFLHQESLPNCYSIVLCKMFRPKQKTSDLICYVGGFAAARWQRTVNPPLWPPQNGWMVRLRHFIRLELSQSTYQYITPCCFWKGKLYRFR